MSAPTFSQLDNDAARRALDYYFNPAPEASPVQQDMQLVVARPGLSAEAAFEQATWLLRHASCTAWEGAQQLRDKAQDQALLIMHLINLARALIEHSQGQTASEPEDPLEE
ncbi:hypothetical protein [Pseudomonas sp. zfem002]|uniref:hypothetical protein n=1 Tax=Pseudomonas sp. zfem002 TaxID=3078197 RepID=UPI002928DB85|nr:hypothetical protein [Pseudomonas sp. zfem002]MDU9393993.1 hypothetical protein [Pseudomonas sp. zfem002]